MSAELRYNNDGAVFSASYQPSAVYLEEQRLLASAKAGDPAAFESLIMPHRQTVHRRALQILHNHEDAEDTVQTAFLQAFRHLGSFEGRSRFSSWLITIATNAALMRLRSSRKKRETSLDQLFDRDDDGMKFEIIEARPDPEQQCSANEVRAILDEALNRLGPLYKQVLQLRDVEDLSLKEAARILEVPVGTVKARLHRARVRLGRNMKPMLVRKRRKPVIRNQHAPASLGRHRDALMNA
jgi:RNA polymerase sigma-70 factor, ECF subfamily